MSSSVNGSSSEKSPEMKKFIEAYHLASEAANDLLNNFKVKADDAYTDNKAKANRVKDNALEMVKEQPLVSIGAAFVTGWIISKLMK